MNRRFGIAPLGLAALFCWLFAVSAWADSQARIVRLSDVEGNVQIDRGTGNGYEKAFLNMPITQGVRLHTTEGARAGVEFEDGSTIHLTPDTVLEFTSLSLRDSGAKVSTIDIPQGLAYFNLTGKHGDEFKITFAQQTATLNRAARFRMDVDKASASLAVFKGNVQVDGPAGAVEVSSKHSATFDLSNNGQFEVAKNIAAAPFDSWDKQQVDYDQRYSASNSFNSPYSYGISDLNYYGSYYDVPGYGLCWQPFFTGLGWDPFMDGAWMWYPGFGYTWVSAYPWGWMPYHYGSWMFFPGYGWMWRPGYNWVGWNTLPPVLHPPRLYVPPRPPVIPHTTVVVGRGPSPSLVSPVAARPGTTVVVNGDSAGLGIPRGMRNLPNLNQQFERNGAVGLATVVGQGGVVSARPVQIPRSAMTGSGPRGSSGTPMSTPRMQGGLSGGRMSSSSHSSSGSSHSSSSSHR